MQHPAEVGEVRFGVLQAQFNIETQVTRLVYFEERLRLDDLVADIQHLACLERPIARDQVGALTEGDALQREAGLGRVALPGDALDIAVKAVGAFGQIVVLPLHVHRAVKGFGGDGGRLAVVIARVLIPLQGDARPRVLIDMSLDDDLRDELMLGELIETSYGYLECHDPGPAM